MQCWCVWYGQLKTSSCLHASYLHKNLWIQLISCHTCLMFVLLQCTMKSQMWSNVYYLANINITVFLLFQNSVIKSDQVTSTIRYTFNNGQSSKSENECRSVRGMSVFFFFWWHINWIGKLDTWTKRRPNFLHIQKCTFLFRNLSRWKIRRNGMKRIWRVVSFRCHPSSAWKMECKEYGSVYTYRYRYLIKFTYKQMYNIVSLWSFAARHWTRWFNITGEHQNATIHS